MIEDSPVYALELFQEQMKKQGKLRVGPFLPYLAFTVVDGLFSLSSRSADELRRLRWQALPPDVLQHRLQPTRPLPVALPVGDPRGRACLGGEGGGEEAGGRGGGGEREGGGGSRGGEGGGEGLEVRTVYPGNAGWSWTEGYRVLPERDGR